MVLHTNQQVSHRLASLDFLRGLIMVLLALEGTGLYEHLYFARSFSKYSFSRQVQIIF